MLHALVLSIALGAAPSPPPALPPGDSARADRDIRLVAMWHASEIRSCYETRGLRVNPSLTGTVEVELTVLPSGRVGEASVTASALVGAGHDEVERCITTVVRNWRYDRGPYGVETIVYPFSLVPEQGKVITTASR